MEELLPKKQLIDIIAILKKIGVQPNHHVADLGCGAQASWTFAASRVVGENGAVYAVDIMKPILASVNSKTRTSGIHNIRTVWTNLEIYGATKIPAESLDFALLVNTLYQSKAVDKVIQEAIRLTKPGGKILIIDWTKANTGFGPLEEHRVSPRQLQELVTQLGLTLVQSFAAGKYHFAFVFQK